MVSDEVVLVVFVSVAEFLDDRPLCLSRVDVLFYWLNHLTLLRVTFIA